MGWRSSDTEERLLSSGDVIQERLGNRGFSARVPPNSVLTDGRRRPNLMYLPASPGNLVPGLVESADKGLGTAVAQVSHGQSVYQLDVTAVGTGYEYTRPLTRRDRLVKIYCVISGRYDLGDTAGQLTVGLFLGAQQTGNWANGLILTPTAGITIDCAASLPHPPPWIIPVGRVPDDSWDRVGFRLSATGVDDVTMQFALELMPAGGF